MRVSWGGEGPEKSSCEEMGCVYNGHSPIWCGTVFPTDESFEY